MPFNHKEYMRRKHTRKIERLPMDAGKHQPTLGSARGYDQGQAASNEGSGRPINEKPRGNTPEENQTPSKRRIWRMPNKLQRRIRKLKKIWARLGEILGYIWYQRPWRKPTPDEQKIKDDFKLRQEMEKLLKDEARLFRQRIINRLNGRELCYRPRRYESGGCIDGLVRVIIGGSTYISSVSFSDIVLQPDAIYLKVNTMALPRGVGVLALVDESVLTDLSIACQHRVTAEYTEKKGLWYVIERASGIRGIPKHVRYQDCLDAYPATAGKFSFPAGVTENNKYIYRDLAAMPHLLIAGSTDAGKSNMMHILITSLIMRTSPRDLRVVMVDLKGGIECAIYEGIPHLLPINVPLDPKKDPDKMITDTGVIYERDAVPAALDYLIIEGEKRMVELRKKGDQNITTYNKKRTTKRMPRIMILIDEWADIRLVPGLGPKAENKLSNIASRMRAVGIHVVLATQSPKAQVISTLIKTNLPGKMAFACPTNVASILIIDNGAARGLQPRGRYIYQKGTEQLEIQAPYISPQHLKRIVAAATTGDKQVLLRGHDLSPAEVVIASIDHFDGTLKLNELYTHFRGRLTSRSLNELLMEMDGQTYEARANTYKVEPPAGPRPRKLILVN